MISLILHLCMFQCAMVFVPFVFVHTLGVCAEVLTTGKSGSVSLPLVFCAMAGIIIVVSLKIIVQILPQN